eukprot:6425872-Amphidinium_carterae.1
MGGQCSQFAKTPAWDRNPNPKISKKCKSSPKNVKKCWGFSQPTVLGRFRLRFWKGWGYMRQAPRRAVNATPTPTTQTRPRT